MSDVRVFRAPWVLASPNELVADGGFTVRAGRVLRVLRGAAEVRRAIALCDTQAGGAVTEIDGVLAPGFVDAHAHLELSGVESSTAHGFVGWVGGILRARAARSRAELEADVRRAAAELLRGGTTTVGDIDTTGAIALLERSARPRTVRYVEVLDAYDPGRSAEALAAFRAAFGQSTPLLAPNSSRARSSDPTLSLGVSPHAPFTVSPKLMNALGRRLARRPVPVAVHWAETREEVDWLAGRGGPLAELLGPAPNRSGLELLDAAGLLGPRSALIHGNHPEPGDWERVVSAGATLVHCPGSHRFFGRAPFPLEELRARGVRIALGTDSRASNTCLDMRHELRLLSAAHPDLPPADRLRMATEHGARALGLGGVVGALTPGAWVDVAAHACSAQDADGILEELASGATEVAGTWVAAESRWRLGVREGRSENG